MSMETMEIPSVHIKQRQDLDHHQVGNLTLEYTSCYQITEKVITPSFDILDSVPIYHLPNFCSVLMVSDKEDKN